MKWPRGARAGRAAWTRHPRTGAVAAATALLVAFPLAVRPAMAGAATRHPAATGHRTQPQRRPLAARTPALATGVRAAAPTPTAGRPVVNGTAVKGAVVKGSVTRSAMGGAPAARPVRPGVKRPVVKHPVLRGPVVGGPGLAGRGIIVHYPAHGARKLPSVPASAYVIADAGTRQVLAAKDPHGHFLPASTLKVLTADTLMPVLKPDATVVTSRLAADVTPNKVGLVKGHAYPVSDLFQALLLISANDAAISLAQATGSYAKGVALMNAEAHRLQADDTVARRPNGLNAKGQHTSAYDLALFARQALTMPEFMRIEATRTAMFPLHRRHSIELFNQNTMLNTYRGDLGGKIGWTTASETTFIAWARRDGHTLIVTLMHCVPLTEMTYAAKLLNWGFAMDGKVTQVGTLVRPLPALAANRAGHSADHRAAGQRVARLAQAASIPAIPVTAGIGGLLLAALVAGGIVLLLRRRAGGGSPPGP
jgi:D-alanyl-D-alanine carboxypeptidase (penicillin-binding protein 5/6)